MSQNSYYRHIEAHTGRSEIAWAQCDNPAVSLINLLTSIEIWGSMESIASKLDALPQNSLTHYPSFVKVLTADSGLESESPVCFYCSGMFDSHNAMLTHPVQSQIQHIVVHSEEYDESEIEVFDNLEDAQDLDSTKVLIARPGIKGSWDGDEYLNTNWINVEKFESTWVNNSSITRLRELLITGLWDNECSCAAGSALFCLSNSMDIVMRIGAIASEAKSFDEVEQMIDEDIGWEELEEFTNEKWQSLAAPHEDWVQSRLMWIGCLDCSKPIINSLFGDAGDQLLALSLTEIEQITDRETIQAFEASVLGIIENDYTLETGYTVWEGSQEFIFDAEKMKTRISGLSESTKSKVPRLIEALMN